MLIRASLAKNKMQARGIDYGNHLWVTVNCPNKILRRLRFFFRVGVPELPESLPFRKETLDVGYRRIPPTIALIDKNRGDPVARGIIVICISTGAPRVHRTTMNETVTLMPKEGTMDLFAKADKTDSGPSWKIVERLCKIQNLQNKTFLVLSIIFINIKKFYIIKKKKQICTKKKNYIHYYYSMYGIKRIIS